MALSSGALTVWAQEEFAHAQLGDRRRTERLVRIAACVAQHPAGTVTQVFAHQPQERDAASDFLENTAISSDTIACPSPRYRQALPGPAVCLRPRRREQPAVCG